ncbi:hypothetical protein IV203_017307 [Nitzschia inconspicua]|uniref:Uncharacterized protein n=1 Tax=Nitzschia inconspicua TaxID=303405 RepID=A0A9K3KRW0_9STRA|nr:hypothetical protein IV203_017307 [Nitzschia inconspicua]
MLLRRSPLKKKQNDNDGTCSTLPLSSPRGTTSRNNKQSGLSMSTTTIPGDDLKHILTVTTGVMMVVLLAILSTSMTFHGGGGITSFGRKAFHGRTSSWKAGYYDAETFPWKGMSRPASKILSDRRHRSTFSTSTNEKDGLTNDTSNFNDKSPFYLELRKSYESFFPPDHRHRSLDVVKSLQNYQLDAYSNPFYDIHNCPDIPPEGYPFQWNLWNEVLAQWPADDTEPPASGTIYQGLCIFDFERDHDKALRYRDDELPFIVRGDPAVAETVERWNTPYYLQALLGDVPQGVEYSDNSDFLYWTNANSRPDADWKPPTQHLEMTYLEWMEKANVTDERLVQPGMPHYYFKVVGCASGGQRNGVDHDGGSTTQQPCSILSAGEHVPYLMDEMPFYTQTHSSLYIKDTVQGTETKAINCRFGMKGVKATNHFDGERNFVTVFQGVRRMILAHPDQCSKLALFPPRPSIGPSFHGGLESSRFERISRLRFCHGERSGVATGR